MYVAKIRRKIWDNYHEIGEAQTSNTHKLVLAAGAIDGLRYINIRQFYLRRKDNTWRPGRDGISFPLKMPINKGADTIFPYEEFAAALQKTYEYLLTMPISDPEFEVWVEPKDPEKEHEEMLARIEKLDIQRKIKAAKEAAEKYPNIAFEDGL